MPCARAPSSRGARDSSCIRSFRPRRRSADRHRGTERRRPCGRTRSGAAGRDRHRQDLHHGQGDRGNPAPRHHPLRPTRRLRLSYTASSRDSSPRTPSNISSATTTTTSPRPMCRARTPTSRRNPRSTKQIDRMRHSATRALLERDDVISGLRLVHLRQSARSRPTAR